MYKSYFRQLSESCEIKHVCVAAEGATKTCLVYNASMTVDVSAIAKTVTDLLNIQ